MTYDTTEIEAEIQSLIATHRMTYKMARKDDPPGWITVWVCKGCEFSAESMLSVMVVEAQHQAQIIVDELGLVGFDEEEIVENVKVEGDML